MNHDNVQKKVMVMKIIKVMIIVTMMMMNLRNFPL
jgi:hypothetical protein